MGEIPILGENTEVETSTEAEEVANLLYSKVQELSVQLEAAQELLARTLYQIGDVVPLSKEDLTKDFHPETGIEIDEDETSFVVHLNKYELVERGQ